MTRKKIVAANWKMNLDLPEGEKLMDRVITQLAVEPKCEVIIAPPFTHIPMMISKVKGTVVRPAAQNCHHESNGAFTGEVSVNMLKSLQVEYIITGHSERRHYFRESNEMIKEKVDSILAAGLRPIFCCGESLLTRESGHEDDFVRNQMQDSLFHLDASAFQQVIIAYEPIWAIGTGITATPGQAEEMHAFIRKTIELRYGPATSAETRILYGGSIKADNAKMLFDQPNVDGGLVGGASLDALGFLAIIQAAC